MLTGGASSHYTRTFETISAIAGEKLLEIPQGALDSEIRSVQNPTFRWYEALKRYSGEYEFGFMGTEKDESGEVLGHIYTGSLRNPVEASRNLALQLSTIKEVRQKSVFYSLNEFFAREAKERKYLWVIVGFSLMAILALLAL